MIDESARSDVDDEAAKIRADIEAAAGRGPDAILMCVKRSITVLNRKMASSIAKAKRSNVLLKGEVIKAGAEKLEGKIPPNTICFEMTKQLHGLISARFVRHCLPDKYKQPYRVQNARKQVRDALSDIGSAAILPLTLDDHEPRPNTFINRRKPHSTIPGQTTLESVKTEPLPPALVRSSHSVQTSFLRIHTSVIAASLWRFDYPSTDAISEYRSMTSAPCDSGDLSCAAPPGARLVLTKAMKQQIVAALDRCNSYCELVSSGVFVSDIVADVDKSTRP